MSAWRPAMMMLARVAASLALVCAGCVSPPPPAAPPSSSPITIPHGAWIAPVAFADPDYGEKARTDTGHAFTLAVATLVADGKYFARVNRLPGNPKPDDYVLRVRFDRFTTVRSLGFGSVGSFLTVGLFDTFGGRSSTVEFEVDVGLRVESVQGERLFESSEKRRSEWGSNDSWAGGDALEQARTCQDAVESLLTDAVRTLQP